MNIIKTGKNNEMNLKEETKFKCGKPVKNKCVFYENNCGRFLSNLERERIPQI